MKVSVNEIKNLGYGDIVSLSVDELVEKIGAQLGAVEEVEDLGAKYQGVVVAKVMSCDDHPNADRLHVCKVDDGGVVEGVERDENGHVQVVCGAPNVREGLLVAWLPPSSTVPETYHHEAPFVLEARELRGVVSNGMLASPKELALGDSHEGILEIDADAKPGQPFADVYHLADHIIDIENKMFTHRPDCFGLLGVAREIAGIQHKAFKSPDWYKEAPKFSAHEGLLLDVENKLADIVPRFMAVALDDVEVKPSPLWLQTTLLRLGSRPINNVVDITNYLMLITGQPLHAYDYDKVASGVLGVRYAVKDENLALLNGKEVVLTEQDIVITDGKKAIGLGGVMGGATTEVDDSTKRIIVEVANFNMYTIRKTSMRHGLFTDAVSRFNKGQSPLQNDRVLTRAVELFGELAGAKAASHVIDFTNDLHDMPAVTVTGEFINARLGLTLSSAEMAKLLTNVECVVEVKGDELKVMPPFWRTDIEIPEDVVEEVGRLYGFDRLPLELPKRSLAPVDKNPLVSLKTDIRTSLARAGANEVLTYSFVHENLLKRAGQHKEEAFELSNALSPDLQYYRLSIMPSLLDKVHPNIKAGHDTFALFEIGKTHNAQRHATDDDGLPREFKMLDVVYASKNQKNEGAPYYQAKHLLMQLADDLGVTLSFAMIEQEDEYPVSKPFDHTRSAYVYVDETLVGMVGEFKASVRKNFKLPEQVAGFTLDIEHILEKRNASRYDYSPLPKFPSTERDVTFSVAASQHFADVERALAAAVTSESLDITFAPTAIYQPEGKDRKNITFKLILTDLDKTIVADAANTALDTIVKAVTSSVDAEVV